MSVTEHVTPATIARLHMAAQVAKATAEATAAQLAETNRRAALRRKIGPLTRAELAARVNAS